MAINKSRMSLRESRPERRSTAEDDSAVSFDQLGGVRPVARYAWAGGNDKVNHDTFHRMAEEYREAKRREGDLQLKTKQLAAQLARTEEAAKRALCSTDTTAKGGAAQKLLDAERALSKLRDENAELRSKLAREKKRASDLKTTHDDTKKRLEQALKDQRLMARKVGDLERKLSLAFQKPEDAYWGEEAGRRFVVQQEELVALREENIQLKQAILQGGLPGTGTLDGTAKSAAAGSSPELEACQAQVAELTALVAFYERKMGELAEQHIIPAQEGISSGPAPDDWILEEHFHEDQVYLLDRKTSKLFTAATANSWPRPVGVRTGSGVKIGSNSNMGRFINTLDNYLKSEQAALEAVFKEFDLDGSGQLDRRELARLIKRLMPELDSRHVEELGAMLDVDGDGQVSFPELLTSIKEAYTARMAAKTGRSPEVNSQLERVREVLREQRKVAREAWDVMDTDHDGCLHHLDVVRLIKQLLRDLSQKEVRYLLAKLQEWDVTGEGKTTWAELLQALELVKIYRVGQGQGGRAVPLSPGRTAAAPGHKSMSVAAARSTAPSSVAQGAKEGFLRERLAQLEAELAAAQRREGVLEADANKVDVLRRDLAVARARIEDLEKDYSRLDVLVRMEAAAASGDTKLQAAWEAASQFKKRYMEHKAELDSIRLTAARMQAQLDETHRLLHDEHKLRFRLEDDNTRLKMETQRVKDLEARLNAERTERVKLEREYLTLQSKALSAPSAALGEVRQLREELFSLRRDKALAEQKEAEVRRELSHVREQLDGMSVDQYRAWQREYHELKKSVASLKLELQAALDKLEVYRRTDNSGVSGIVYGNKEVPSFLDRRPDVDKNEDEIRKELAQLRDVWHADQLELKKLHHVLETESAQTLEAKAALEEAHKEMDRVRRDLQDQMKNIQRELDRRDERIRKLELQLRGAYSGINRALRTSNLRDSRATDCPDDLSELGDDQNLLELHISEATLYEEVLGKDPSTFFTFDFFMHESQATPVLASNTPAFDTLVQYVVDADTFLLQYLDSHVLELELNRARGWDYDPIGVARISLRQIIEDVEIGAALGHNRAYHYADVYGADGKRIGRVRYGFAFRRPLDTLIRDYRLTSRSKRPSDPDARDPAAAAVALAQSNPSAASHIKVIVARCEQLVAPSGSGATCRPYVWFRMPGHREPHCTRMAYGLHPTYEDTSTWLISRSSDLEHNFKSREMEFVVFDDAGGEDPLRSIIGVAFVPLASLAQGLPVEGAFKLINPVSKQPAGKLILGMGWHNPLALPSSAPSQPVRKAAAPATGASTTTLATSPAVLYGQDAGPAKPAAPAPPALPQFPPRHPPAGQYGLEADLANAGQQATLTGSRAFVPPRFPSDRLSVPDLSGAPLSASQAYYAPAQPPQPAGYGIDASSPVPGYSQSPQIAPRPGGYGTPQDGGYGLWPDAGQPGVKLMGVEQAGRQRYGLELEQSASPPPLRQQPQQVLPAFTILSPDRTQWPASTNHILLAVHGLRLESSYPLSRSHPYVFVMHVVTEEAVPRLEDTCTEVVPVQPGVMLPFRYAACYRVSGPAGDMAAAAAGASLLARMADPLRGGSLDLRVFAGASPRLDLSQLATNQVISLGVASVPFAPLLAGARPDLSNEAVDLIQEGTNARIGSLVLTVVATAALRSMQAPQAPQWSARPAF